MCIRDRGEIPRFALTVGQSLENDRDVLKILTSYRRVAGKDFGAELDQTIADMKTGNYENALIRFETRIGSPMPVSYTHLYLLPSPVWIWSGVWP